MNKDVYDIIYSKTKIKLYYPGKRLEEALNFGFSYIEQKDYIVEYIIANNYLMKRIFVEINDSILMPENKSIGKLWTAHLFLSDKLLNSQLALSNKEFSVILDIDLNPEREYVDANV